jgi:hypothetical protein
MVLPAPIASLRVVLIASLLGLTACSGQPVAAVAAAPSKAEDQTLKPMLQQAAKPAATQAVKPAVAQATRPAATQAARPASTTSTAQAPKPAPPATKASAQDLPPLSYVCIMPGDEAVLEDKPGKCPNPKCGMQLVPIRIVQAWSCLSNTAFIQENPGKCRTDGTDLVPVNVSMFWACSSTPDKHQLNPDKCADGSTPARKYEPRPHGDHNPRHGGQLFMADDAWHHLEGAYPSAGLLRVYFYDDFTRPMAPTGFNGSAVVRDTAGKDIATVPLKAGKISNTMEAQIANATLPLTIHLLVGFKPGDRQRVFDFVFPEYTKEPIKTTANQSGASTAPMKPGQSTAPATATQGRSSVPTAAASQGRGATTATPATGRGRSGPTTTAAQKPATPTPQPAVPQPDPTMVGGLQQIPGGGTVEYMPSTIIPQEDPIPPTSKGILAELATKSEEVESLIKGGGAGLAAVWLPAMRSKNLALALLDDHLNEIPDRERPVAQSAVYRLLLAAWQIDTLGDLGDQGRILTVHAAFTAAIADLNKAYASLQ